MSGAINSQSFVSSVNVQSRFGEAMNIPELIMAVQIQRGNVLENQVKDQIDDMQKRNEWLKTANDALAALRSARPPDKDARVDYTTITFKDGEGKQQNAIDWLASQGVVPPIDRPAIAEATRAGEALKNQLAFIDQGIADKKWAAAGWVHFFPSFQNKDGTQENVAAWAKEKGLTSDGGNGGRAYTDLTGVRDGIAGKIKELGSFDQAGFDSMISNVKGAVDTVNSQSQMDMVRLQGLMDKRNQSFDMLTNSLSKFSKSMDSVIGNMR